MSVTVYKYICLDEVNHFGLKFQVSLYIHTLPKIIFQVSQANDNNNYDYYKL